MLREGECVCGGGGGNGSHVSQTLIFILCVDGEMEEIFLPYEVCALTAASVVSVLSESFCCIFFHFPRTMRYLATWTTKRSDWREPSHSSHSCSYQHIEPKLCFPVQIPPVLLEVLEKTKVSLESILYDMCKRTRLTQAALH